MTRKTISSRRQQRRPARSAAAHVFLPHSSWASAERKPVPSATIEADDFWERLGL